MSSFRLLWEGNRYANGINDFFKEVEQNLYKVQYRVLLSRYGAEQFATNVKGIACVRKPLYIKVGGRHIWELCALPGKDLKAWFDQLLLSEYDQQVAKRILSKFITA
jgi:excinuclease ABC subunit A